MSNGPPPSRDRRSLQDLAKLATSPASTPLSSRTPTPPPSSVKPVSSDSGIVDLQQIATGDPGAVERAKSTPLASAPLFEDDGEAPSIPPPARSSRPAPSSPAAAPSSRRLPAAAAAKAVKKPSLLMPVVGGLLLAAAAAGVFIITRPAPSPPHPTTAAPTSPPPPVAPVTSAEPAAPPAPVAAAPAASEEPAADPAPPSPGTDTTKGATGPAGGGRRAPSGAGARTAKEAPGGSTVSGLSAMMAQATNSTTTQAPTGPAGSLGDAVKNAVGDNGAPAAPAPGADPAGPQFAPGSVPQKPSQGAVTGALGRVLPQARNCLNPDDPISRANVTFASAGSVTSVVVSGNAAGKPAEDCIKRALLKASVPPFVQDSYSANVTIRPN